MSAAPTAQKPTPGERADAHDRLIAALDEAGAAISAAHRILREPPDTRRSNDARPMFPFDGNDIYQLLNKASETLWAAHKIAAAAAYDYHAEARKAGGS